MRSTTLALIASLGLAAPLAAQQAYRAAPSRSPVLATPPSIDPERVEALLALADSATYAGRVNEARSIYTDLMNQQRDAGQFAHKATWRLALNYLYADKPLQAVHLLDQLAADADRYGAPSVSLRASFESAVIWMQLKRPELAAARIERSRQLLQSPDIPDAEKASVRARMK